MSYNVIVSKNASQDIIDIYYNDLPENAEYVLEQLEKVINSLTYSPNRGSYPKELIATGNKDFKELYFKPYRIIYEVKENDVNVLIVADGRRDMRKLLTLRILL